MRSLPENGVRDTSTYLLRGADQWRGRTRERASHTQATTRTRDEERRAKREEKRVRPALKTTLAMLHSLSGTDTTHTVRPSVEWRD